MSVCVDIRHRQGDFHLEAAFETGEGLTALHGPSGSGKTTLVNIVAGLIRPEYGHVRAGEVVWVDTERRIAVPPYRRRIGYVFQEGRLFPHLTVRQNLNYGRWFAPRAERSEDLDHVVGLLGIGGLLERRPASLSGGEKQRVAIGRALMASPKMLLMDEPLAALDMARKAEILPYVERLRDEVRVPIIYVSHSVQEVARLATNVVRLADGKVVATGSADEVIPEIDGAPGEGISQSSAFLDAVVEQHLDDWGLTVLRSPAGAIRLRGVSVPIGAQVRVRIRAQDVVLATEEPQSISTLNVLRGTVLHIETGDGPDAFIQLNCGGERLSARITRYSADRLGLVEGSPVFALVKAVSIDQGSLFRRTDTQSPS
jgi:molybdate transport system ATP-binding protein